MRTMLLSAALLLLLLLPVALTQTSKQVPFDLVVENSILGTTLTYSTHVAYRGILLGAMKRLMDSNANFKFTYSEDPNYGPYLESVNGVAGNNEDHTYWQLLVKTADGNILTADVGIGCYILKADEQIILKFTKW